MGMLLSRRRASVGAVPAVAEPTVGALLDENLSLRQENAAVRDELSALKGEQEGGEADLSDDDDSGDESDGASTGSRKRKKS